MPAGGRAALAAAGVLLASCAAYRLDLPPGLEFKPAGRTTLVSDREQVFLVAEHRQDGRLTTILARQQAGAPPNPVARLVRSRPADRWQVSIQLLPGAAGASGRAIDELATLEQLYSLLLRQEPEARFCLGDGTLPCDADRDGTSHAQLLKSLAERRTRLADRIDAAVPWRVVEMQATPNRSWDADVVAVRATAQQAPLEGVDVFFNRAPHSICRARTRADGVATCRLVDPHGDEHLHDHAAPVVATFPGEVGALRVLPPTTQLLPAPPGARRLPFAPPIRP